MERPQRGRGISWFLFLFVSVLSLVLSGYRKGSEYGNVSEYRNATGYGKVPGYGKESEY